MTFGNELKEELILLELEYKLCVEIGHKSLNQFGIFCGEVVEINSGHNERSGMNPYTDNSAQEGLYEIDLAEVDIKVVNPNSSGDNLLTEHSHIATVLHALL